MSELKYRLANLIRRVAKLEQADSAESAFFDNPNKRNVRQFAESKAITNKVDTVKSVVKNQETVKSDELIKSEALVAPPPPEEIVKKPGGKELSTLNQFIVKTEEDIKGVPDSHDETSKAEAPLKNPSKKEIKKDLIDRVVERHLSQKDKVKAVKNVLKEEIK